MRQSLMQFLVARATSSSRSRGGIARALAAGGLLFSAMNAQAAGTLCWGATNISVPEGGGSAFLAVVRSQSGDGAVSASYTSQGVTAVPNLDYFDVAGTSVFDSDDLAAKTVEIPVLDNSIRDGNRTFEVRLVSTVGAQLCPGSVATVTIIDDEIPPAGELSLERSAYSISETGGALAVRVLRQNGSRGPASAVLTATVGTATGDDFRTVSQVVSWDNGDTAPKTVNISILDDALREGNEAFSLSLQNVQGAIGGQVASSTVTIVDDEVLRGGVAQFVSRDIVVGAQQSVAVVEVARLEGVTGAVSVEVATDRGSATDGSFTPINETLRWEAGEASVKTLSIQLRNTAIDSGRSFSVVLRNPRCLQMCEGSAFRIGEPSIVSVTFGDVSQAGVMSLTRTEASIAEGSERDVGVLGVRRDSGVSGSVTVRYQIVERTARFGAQLPATLATGTLFWGAGDGSPKAIPLTALVDANEVNEEFEVVLVSANGNATLGTSRAVVTIVDRNSSATAAGSFVIGGPSLLPLSEKDARLDVEVIRQEGFSGAVSVDCVFESGSARSGVDFTATRQTLTWANGERGSKFCTVRPVDDSVANGGSRQFSVRLVNSLALTDDGEVGAGAGASIIAPGFKPITLLDDEVFCASGSIVIDTATTSVRDDEGAITLRVRREGGVCGEVSAAFRVLSGSALIGSDIIPASAAGNFIFADGEGGFRTLSVNVVRPTGFEQDEFFTLEIEGQTVGGFFQSQRYEIRSSVGRPQGGGGSLGIEGLAGVMALWLVRRRRKTV